MSATKKKTTKKATLNGAAKTEKKVNYVIDPETGKKISKTWYAFKKNIGTGQILDMRAVLK